jgi:hypothetical protein
MIKTLEAAKTEKQGLLASERNLVNELYKIHSEKEVLLETKRKTQDEIQKRIEEIDELLVNEEIVIEAIRAARAEKESILEDEKAALEGTDKIIAKKEALLKKETEVTLALQKFQAQRRAIVASGGSTYSFVNATLSISHLIKESFLSSQVEKSLIAASPPRSKTNVLVKKTVYMPTDFMKKALGLEGKKFMSHFVGFLSLRVGKTTEKKC